MNKNTTLSTNEKKKLILNCNIYGNVNITLIVPANLRNNKKNRILKEPTRSVGN